MVLPVIVAEGITFTDIIAVPVPAALQPLKLTLVILYEVLLSGLTLYVPLPDPSKVIIPPLLKLIRDPAVPETLRYVEDPIQIVAEPDIEAVGNAFTVIKTDPLPELEQLPRLTEVIL